MFADRSVASIPLKKVGLQMGRQEKANADPSDFWDVLVLRQGVSRTQRRSLSSIYHPVCLQLLLILSLLLIVHFSP